MIAHQPEDRVRPVLAARHRRVARALLAAFGRAGQVDLWRRQFQFLAVVLFGFGNLVAGELTGVDPQMLRVYESRGLLTPSRTGGGTRRYSDRDIERIQRIAMYLDAGLNLAGIERVFVLEAETDDLRDQVRKLGGRPRRPR